MAKRGRRVDRDLIKRVGRRCLWRSALLCPCQRADGGQDALCTACDERGYLYGDTTPLSALLTGDGRKEQFDMQTAWEKGTARATIDCDIDVGSQDQLIVLDMPVRDFEVVTRAAGTLIDTLRTPRVERVIRLHTSSRGYTLGSDFTLATTSAGVSTITWINGGAKPTDGERYTAQIAINPIWIIASHPMSRTFGPSKKQQLPWRCDLERYDRAIARDGVQA